MLSGEKRAVPCSAFRQERTGFSCKIPANVLYFNMYSYANFLGALNFSRQYRKEKMQRTAKKEME